MCCQSEHSRYFFKVNPTDFLIDWMQDLMGDMKDFWTFCSQNKEEATGSVLSMGMTWLYLCFSCFSFLMAGYGAPAPCILRASRFRKKIVTHSLVLYF